MPFQIGNQEAKKADHRRAKLFRDALLVALKETDDGGVEPIQLVVAKLIELALQGNVIAIKEIADRLDGKPPQAILGDEDQPLKAVNEIIWTIIDPKESPCVTAK